MCFALFACSLCFNCNFFLNCSIIKKKPKYLFYPHSLTKIHKPCRQDQFNVSLGERPGEHTFAGISSEKQYYTIKRTNQLPSRNINNPLVQCNLLNLRKQSRKTSHKIGGNLYILKILESKLRYNACGINVCRFPGVYKTKESTNTLRLRYKQNELFQNFCTWHRQVITPDAVRMFLQKSHVKFPENFWKNLCLTSWKILQNIIMTWYKHLTQTITNTHVHLILLWFMLNFVLINKFGFPLHLAFAKYLYM
jgi:hypothetical protein